MAVLARGKPPLAPKSALAILQELAFSTISSDRPQTFARCGEIETRFTCPKGEPRRPPLGRLVRGGEVYKAPFDDFGPQLGPLRLGRGFGALDDKCQLRGRARADGLVGGVCLRACGWPLWSGWAHHGRDMGKGRRKTAI